MKFSDIPDEFLSFESGQPFQNCKICDRDLTDPNTHYVIEKAIRKYSGYKAWDVVFEYAICIDCAESFRKEMSKESIESIEKYFMGNANLTAHAERISKNIDTPNISDYTNNCLIKGLDKSEVEEYQIYGECIGNRFLYGNMPYMISGQAMDEIANLLSTKTLDELDGFAGKHLGPSPELEKLFKGRKVVLI